MSHPYRTKIEASDRKLTITTSEGVRVETYGDFLGPFEVHYDGSGTAAGVRVYANGVHVTMRVLAQPARVPVQEVSPPVALPARPGERHLPGNGR